MILLQAIPAVPLQNIPSPSATMVLFAVILAVVITVSSAIYLIKVTGKLLGNERHALLNVVVFGFSVLLSIYFCDKIIAFKYNLLTDQESISIFNLIKDITLLVFGYYFGVSKVNDKKPRVRLPKTNSKINELK